MKKIIIQTISLIVVLSTMLTMISCMKKPDEQTASTTKSITKAQTSEAVKIVEVPKDKDTILKMFNAAIDYVNVYCYGYTKTVNTSVTGISVGSLSVATNARDAFNSIFGGGNRTNKFSYNSDKDAFDANFLISGFKAEEITDAFAVQDGDKIVLEVAFAGETNPDKDKGVLSRLGGDYLSVSGINDNLSSFNSSANTVNITVQGVKAVAQISAEDSSLQSLEVRYTEKYALSGVKLVELEGDSVTGSAATIVKYSDIG